MSRSSSARSPIMLLLASLLLTFIALSPHLRLAAQDASVEKIAFVTAVEATGISTIMLADSDGSNLQPFITNETLIYPVWSPDGRHLAFSASLPGYRRTDVYVIDSDGTNLHKVTTRQSQYPSAVAWSPDSQQLIYVLNLGAGTRAELHRVNSDGTDDAKIQLPGSTYPYTFNIMGSWVAWSPDGAQIAFLAADDNISYKRMIFLANVDGSNVQPFPATAPNGDFFEDFAWSPNGQQVALGGALNHFQITVANLDGSNLRDLPGTHNNSWNAAWSPDGSRIVFAAPEAGVDWMPDPDLWVVGADGSNLYTLAIDHYVVPRFGASWGLIPADVVLPSTPIVLSAALE